MPSAPTRKFFKTISFRVSFLFSICFAVGIALAFLITYLEIGYSLERSDREVISSKLRETATVLNSDGIRGLRDFFSVEKNRLTNAPFMVRILTANGDTLYLKPSVQEKTFDFEAAFKDRVRPDSQLGWRSIPAVNDEDRFDILTEKVSPEFYLQIGESNEDRDAILENILGIFGSTLLLLTFLGGGLGLWYATRILKPLRGLIGTIQEIEKGDFSRRVKLGEVKDEIHDLGSTFNRMIGRIESLIRIMRESLDHVAHDIRTPLTRIKAVAEDAMTSNRPLSLREALEDCAEGATGISGIVDQLLSISEAESGTMNLKLETCDVPRLIKEVLEIYEFVALEKSIRVELDVEPSRFPWRLDLKKTKQAVANLLDNAIKFSPEGSKISIRARNDDDRLDDLRDRRRNRDLRGGSPPQIWDRLFRGDRSRTAPGSGLGLSIVRAVVAAHGGKVVARPNPGRGTTFSVEIPPSNP